MTEEYAEQESAQRRQRFQERFILSEWQCCDVYIIGLACGPTEREVGAHWGVWLAGI